MRKKEEYCTSCGDVIEQEDFCSLCKDAPQSDKKVCKICILMTKQHQLCEFCSCIKPCPECGYELLDGEACENCGNYAPCHVCGEIKNTEKMEIAGPDLGFRYNEYFCELCFDDYTEQEEAYFNPR